MAVRLYRMKPRFIFLREVEAPKIENAREAWEYILRQKFDPSQEHVFLLVFDVRGRVVETEVFRGTLDQAEVNPLTVWKTVLAVPQACAFLMAHNHPSGDPEPSPSDISFTKQINAGAKVLGIDFLDHVVFTDTSYYSMAKYRVGGF